MSEVRRVKAASIFPFISELFELGQSVKLPVSGDSMNPFLHDGIDSVELTKGSFEQISRGDIVMIQRTDGSYVMHRVIKKKADSIYMVGDAQQWIEGPLYREQLVAVVTAIWRQNKRISCSNKWWRFLSWLWLWLRPFRYFIFRVNRNMKKLLKPKSSKN